MSKIVGVGAVLATLLLLNVSSGSGIVRRSCYPTFHAPVINHHRHVEQILVPYALPIELTKDYYFSIDSYYRDKLLVDAIVGRLQGDGGSGIPPKDRTPHHEKPSSVPTDKLDPTAVPEGLVKVVANSCIKCHAKDNPGGRADLSDLSTVGAGLRWHAHGLVNSGEMPKGVAALKDEEVLLFYEWAKVGSKAATAALKKGK